MLDIVRSVEDLIEEMLSGLSDSDRRRTRAIIGEQEELRTIKAEDIYIGPNRYDDQRVIDYADRLDHTEESRFKLDDLIVAKYAMTDESHISVSKVVDILIHKRFKTYCKGCQLKDDCEHTKEGALLLRTDGEVSMMCEWQAEPANEREEFAYHMFGADAHEDDK